MNAPPPVLRLERLRKAYLEGNGQRLPILGIDEFELQAGEQMALVGPSGCGKTTLLHVIAGISLADEGRVLVTGIDMTRLSEVARDRVRAAKVGYVFQTFNLLPGFTALENVMLGMTFARGKRDESRARELLASVGLDHRTHHKPAKLSVGEQQRVAVARSLANRPALLLADEPTANVDPANQANVIELIRKSCAAEQVGLIIVTHAIEVASQFTRVDRLQEINHPDRPFATSAEAETA